MDIWSYLILFLFGNAVGSFLNVAILRYDPDRKLFQDVNGRSHCMSCGKTLRWYELIPLFSFIFQLGRCRSCKARLSLQYPIVEFITGLIFVLVPYFLTPLGGAVPYLQIATWLAFFVSLLLITVIDIRHYIIPDGLNITIFILAIVNLLSLSYAGDFGQFKDQIQPGIFGSHAVVSGTLLGTFANFLFFNENAWLNFLLGGLFGGLFFGLIYFLSRGQAMGFGDVKLALVSGFLLGLPDMIVATMLAFITGAAWGLALMILGSKGLKSMLPFGPFIALGITLVFFFGYDLVNGYFDFWGFLE